MATAKPSKPNNQPDNAHLIRLNRFLAMAGLGSRRACDDLIAKGLVKVNGEVITRMGVRIDPEKDTVEYQGRVFDHAEPPVYILLNKPSRTVTTASDERRRRTVLDIIGANQRLFPVGRLDYHTTGALLITNDGDMSYYLIHPRFEVNKTYRVMLNRVIRAIDLHHFQAGVMLDDKKTAPCKAQELRRMDNRSYLEVELHEGRNRQIRRMFEGLGYHVEELHRHSFAGLQVNDLKPGEWRELTRKEVVTLKALVESFKKIESDESPDK